MTTFELDHIIGGFDRALRTLSGQSQANRPSPATSSSETELSTAELSHSAGLMRVNHTGEICAQALYEGQALTAKDPKTTKLLAQAAEEESDHLVWCEERLQELDARPSILNPLFYAASFGIGAVTGLLGDKISLGFVEATENQVCEHLSEHMDQLPEADQRSREVIAQMAEDEAQHGHAAIAGGGVSFPEPVKQGMRLVSKIMTATTYRV